MKTLLNLIALTVIFSNLQVASAVTFNPIPSNSQYAYYIQPSKTHTFDNAQSFCQSHRANLTKIRNKNDQDELGKLARRKVDPKAGLIVLWIGGKRSGNASFRNWRWLDGTSVPLESENDFPRWASGRPSTGDERYSRLWLSSYGEFGPTGTNPNRTLYWENREPKPIGGAGYICERIDACLSNPCMNGRCVDGLLLKHSCVCYPGYTGTNCETAVFRPISEDLSCTYHIQNQTANLNYTEAMSTCESYDSNLAIIKSKLQQDGIGRLARSLYVAGNIYLWIGGERHGIPKRQDWRWLDNTTIPLTSSNNYPRWGSGKPSIGTTNRVKLLLSTWPELAHGNSNHERIFHLVNREPSLMTGYVCERPASKHICDSDVCRNGGNCTKWGCSYSCACIPPFRGLNCTQIPTKLVQRSSSSGILNNNFTLNCQFDGIPLPDVSWKIGDNDKLYTNNESMSHGSPFTIQNTIINATLMTSTFSFISGGLCLGRINISCQGINGFSMVSNNFEINHVNYTALGPRYYILHENATNQLVAKETCNRSGTGGVLTSVTTNATQNLLADTLSQNKVSSAWIGLERATTSDEWAWVNGERINFTKWAIDHPQEGKSCVKMFKVEGWLWQSDYCEPNFINGNQSTSGFVCELVNHNVPTIHVSSPKCTNKSDGISLKIEWQPSPMMLGILHRVNLSGNISDLVPQDNNIISHTLNDLLASKQYAISISVAPEVCRLPITTTNITMTGNFIPQPVTNLSAEIVADTTCRITWLWPSDNVESINKFTISVSGSLNTYWEGNDEWVSSTVSKESFSNDTGSDNRSFSFNINPNRRHKIIVKSQSASCVSPTVSLEEKCVTPPVAPASVPSLTVFPQENEELVLKFSSADEKNGAISCYFIIGEYNDTKAELRKSTPSLELLRELADRDVNELPAGQEYVAKALQGSIRGDVLITLGDNTDSSCNIFNITQASSTRKRRSAENVFNGKNFPLLPGKFYSFYTMSATPINETHVEFATSSVTTHATPETASTTDNTIYIIIAVVVIFLLIFVGVLVFLIKRRKRLRTEKLTNEDVNMTDRAAVEMQENEHALSAAVGGSEFPLPAESTEDLADGNIDAVYENVQTITRSTAIPLADLKKIYQSLMDSSSTVIDVQYQNLSKISKELGFTQNVATRNENTKMNRYKNIIPYDNNRVKLNGEKNYINASYVDSYNLPRYFIAAQGPLIQTVQSFWEMVWENNCSIIVMLTNLIENKKKKCHQYWPEPNTPLKTGDLQISAESENPRGSYVIRTFHLSRIDATDYSRMITHIQFTQWPDHDVPLTTTGVLRLYGEMIKLREQSKEGPIVVHCSAGVGRTGTLIALDYLSREMKAKSSIDIYAAVKNMRRQRCQMVQNVKQYRLTHKLVAEVYLLGDTDLTTQEFQEKMRLIDSWLDKEFANINTIKPLKISQEQGSSAKNLAKNRNQENIPYDHSRVVLQKQSFEDDAPYINASFVEIHDRSKKTVAAQGPMSSTVKEFWRAIWQQEIDVIVTLTPLEENKKEMCYRYWPDEVSSSVQFGDVSIVLTAEQMQSKSMLRTFEVCMANAQRTVHQLHYPCWAINGKPPPALEIIQVHNLYTELRDQSHNPSTLIHCSDGLSQTGVFCTLINLIERFNAEQKIDVFRQVKDLRDMRPGMVLTAEQYGLCYTLIQEYLSAFNTYSNFG